MDYSKAVAISAAGMAAQKTRVEAATMNLANMHASAPPGSVGYRPMTAVIRAVPGAFARAFDGSEQVLMIAQAAVAPRTDVVTRTAYEPGHPHADSAGMVSYPAIDPTQEMMTVMTALRAYEANLAALQATRSLGAKALEIGGGQ